MDKNKLLKLANLARIEIKYDDIDKILHLVNSDINQVKTIDNIDTEGLKQLTNPYDMVLEMSEDVVSDGDKQNEIMNCAQENMYNYYIVPKVIDN